MATLPKALLLGLAATLGVMTPAAATTIYRQVLQNNTGQEANDFTAVFTGPANTLGTVQLRNPTTSTTSSGVTSGLTVTFATGTFAAVGAGGTNFIEWETGNRTNVLDRTLSRWTSNGNAIGANTMITAGPPQRINREAFTARLDFTNPNAFTELVTNIRAFADNDPANFSLAQAFTPTGTLVSGLPTSLTLQPGETAELTFAVTSLLTYDLVFADFALASNPSVTFQSITAEFDVPEPASCLLLGLGALTLIAFRRWMSIGVPGTAGAPAAQAAQAGTVDRISERPASPPGAAS
jgi:hypothetical protein